jgi:predicted transposase YbfD/YdcC
MMTPSAGYSACSIRSGSTPLALKGNQGTLHADVALFLGDPQLAADGTHTTVDGEHGRIETRTASMSSDIAWLQSQHAWPGLAAVGKVVRTRETAAKTTTETAHYLLSTALGAERFGAVARHHWGIENRLHWVLDVTMNEDQTRNRKGHGAENLALLRRLALNLARLEPATGSMKGKLKRAGWDNAFRTQLFAQFANPQMR